MCETLLNVDAVAARLSVCGATVRRLEKAGRLKGVRIGARLLFREQDISEFIGERCTVCGAQHHDYEIQARMPFIHIYPCVPLPEPEKPKRMSKEALEQHNKRKLLFRTLKKGMRCTYMRSSN